MTGQEAALRALMRSDRKVQDRRRDAQELKDQEVNETWIDYGSEHSRERRRKRDGRRLAKIASDPTAYEQHKEHDRAVRKARKEIDRNATMMASRVRSARYRARRKEREEMEVQP